MGRFTARSRPVKVAVRGQIVQRVLVDRWSAAEAAVAFGLSERQVTRWVAAYRRHGMASLRDSGESAARRWLRRLGAAFGRIAGGWLVAGQIAAPRAAAPRAAVRLARRQRPNGVLPR